MQLPAVPAAGLLFLRFLLLYCRSCAAAAGGGGGTGAGAGAGAGGAGAATAAAAAVVRGKSPVPFPQNDSFESCQLKKHLFRTI